MCIFHIWTGHFLTLQLLHNSSNVVILVFCASYSHIVITSSNHLYYLDIFFHFVWSVLFPTFDDSMNPFIQTDTEVMLNMCFFGTISSFLAIKGSKQICNNSDQGIQLQW